MVMAARCGRARPRALDPAAILLAALAMAAPTAAGTAEAQLPSKVQAPISPANSVEIVVVGTAADLQRIRTLVQPRQPGGWVPTWTRVGSFDPFEMLQTKGPRPSGVALRCWVDISERKRARLYFAARSGQQFLVRDVEISGTFDELDRESLSQVLELSVTALLENERAGLTRAQTEALLSSRQPEGARASNVTPHASVVAPPLSTSTPARPGAPPLQPLPPPPVSVAANAEPRATLQRQASAPQAPWRSTLGIWYGAQLQGGGLPMAHGPGVSLTHGKTQGRVVIGGWASGQYQVPEQQAGVAVGIRLQTIALRAGPELLWTNPGYRLCGRLGIGSDLVRVEPQLGSADQSVTLNPPQWTQSLVFRAVAGVQRAVGAHILLGLLASVDLQPTAVHFDLRASGTVAEVFSPWHVRPGLALELALH